MSFDNDASQTLCSVEKYPMDCENFLIYRKSNFFALYSTSWNKTEVKHTPEHEEVLPFFMDFKDDLKRLVSLG